MGPQGSHALARALASGNLSCLEYIWLGADKTVGDHVMMEVIKGLRGCHQVREVAVIETGMGVVAGQALVQALQDKAWPALTSIRVKSSVLAMLA